MLKTADSALGRWAGRMILQYCPNEQPGCEVNGCWAAPLCRAARAAQPLGLWQALAVEGRREAFVWLMLTVGSFGVLVIALACVAWP